MKCVLKKGSRVKPLWRFGGNASKILIF